MEYYKNDLIDSLLDRTFQTWEHTLDTEDFVQKKFSNKIDSYIFNNLKKQFKEINIFYLLKLKYRGIKLSLFDNLRVFFSGLEPKYISLHQKDYFKYCKKYKKFKK